MKQVRSHHSNEFKIKAVELCKQSGNVAATSKELNVNHETVRLWIKAYDTGKFTKNIGVVEKQKSKEEIENARLRKELYEVTLERDILKKAVGIFSKSDR
jgi:transposase